MIAGSINSYKKLGKTYKKSTKQNSVKNLSKEERSCTKKRNRKKLDQILISYIQIVFLGIKITFVEDQNKKLSLFYLYI
jgi:hypothetical protein